MDKSKKLSKKQLAVIKDMFAAELDEQAVLEKHKVSRNVYNRWLADGLFASEFGRRIMSARRQSAALIAGYGPLAVAKLVQLTESEKAEVARKACLDIISLSALLDKQSADPNQTNESGPASPGRAHQLSQETASRLLAALADAER